MAPAASLLAAAEQAQSDIVAKFSAAANLRTLLTSWATAIPTALTEPNNVEQRRTLNWLPMIRELIETIPSAQASQILDNANNMGVMVYRNCLAAYNSNISNAQKAALLASYNLLFA